MKKHLKMGLCLTVVFQFFILTGMYVKAAIPLWTGQEIKVKTIPVDPRSLFRGNYARLGYEFSTVDSNFFSDEENLRTGEVVYVSLKQDEDGFYTLSSASLEKPAGEIFLTGRADRIRYRGQKLKSYTLNFGIEAFFAPKEKALALENDLRDGGVAVLMVDDDGRARIKEVIGE